MSTSPYSFLGEKINEMVKNDGEEMKKAEKSGQWEGWHEVTKKNTEELKALLIMHGWPTIGMVGPEVARNAWFIVQHADADPAFQEQCLELMKQAHDKNPSDILLPNLAFLIDRVLVNKNQKQIFGTQFRLNDKGKLVPKPIQDEENLDKKRAEYGLPPFEEYLKSAEEYKPYGV